MSDYPDSLNVRPLTTWPGTLTPGWKRQRSPYSAPLRSTLRDLGVELRAINAVNVLLEVAIPENQFRIDGRPYLRAQAEHPGVVLSLPRSDAGALRFACDRYTDWQSNLRAVVLTMEALRAVERHGAVQAREQYAGFKALPPGATPMPAGPAAMTVDDAARILHAAAEPDSLEVPVEALITDPSAARLAYRTAARRHHPDVGGERARWDQLEQAKRVLDEHAGGTS